MSQILGQRVSFIHRDIDRYADAYIEGPTLSWIFLHFILAIAL